MKDLPPPLMATAPLLWLNGKPVSRRGWPRAFKRDRSLNLLGGTISLPLTAAHGVDAFISSLPVFHASPTPLPASAAAPMTSAGYGPSAPASSKKSSPRESFLKTSPACLGTPEAILAEENWKTPQMTLLAEWEPYSGIWPDSGLLLNGCVYARPTWEPPTSGNAFSYWPTANSHDAAGKRPEHFSATDHHYKPHDLNTASETWRTPDAPSGGGVRNRQGSIGAGHQTTIAEQAEHWRTPDATRGGGTRPLAEIQGSGQMLHLKEQTLNWSTPRAEDGESAGNHPNAQDSLTGQTRLWITPHGMGNRDSTGKANGAGGGEFSKQANRWATPISATEGSSGGLKTGDGRDKSDLAVQARNFTPPPSTDPQTPAGISCWCGSAGCALPSHRRKLNPLFVSVLMNWPPWWLTIAPSPYGRWATEYTRYKRQLLLSSWYAG